MDDMIQGSPKNLYAIPPPHYWFSGDLEVQRCRRSKVKEEKWHPGADHVYLDALPNCPQSSSRDREFRLRCRCRIANPAVLRMLPQPDRLEQMQVLLVDESPAQTESRSCIWFGDRQSG